MDAGGAEDLWEFVFGDECAFAFGELAPGMMEEVAEVFGVTLDGEAAEEHAGDIRGAGDGNFRVSAHDDGVAVMPGVGPAPYR